MAHPLSLAAQKLLHTRQTASPASRIKQLPTNTTAKAIKPLPSFTTPNSHMQDSSVLPEGTKTPKAKRSTKAARNEQADSPDSADPANFQESFADGGEVGEVGDVEMAGAKSGFKAPKNLRPVRGGPSPAAQPFVPTEEMRALPAEVKPPAAPQAATEAGADPFAMLERDLPKGEGLGAEAGGGAALNDVEEAGIKALVRRYLPEAVGGTAGLVAQGMLQSASPGEPDQDQVGTAATHAYQKSQALHKQGGPAGALWMSKHGSDADSALATEFLRHLKKNAAAQ